MGNDGPERRYFTGFGPSRTVERDVSSGALVALKCHPKCLIHRPTMGKAPADTSLSEKPLCQKCGTALSCATLKRMFKNAPKKPRGRPPKPEGEARTEVIRMRATKAEKASYDKRGGDKWLRRLLKRDVKSSAD